MALPEFKNEQEFRDQWIAPFLWKLGFMRVKNTHGTGEQGKDFFFADYDRFGHTRVYAAQVKLGNIGSGGTELGNLLDQVKRCFEVRLAFHKGAHEQRIAAAYVMTSGSISETARQRIHEWCITEKFGENVFFLDGEQLDNRNRFITYESDQEKRQFLIALNNEVSRNLVMLHSQRADFANGKRSFSAFRLGTIETAIQRTPMAEGTETEPIWNALESIWSRFSIYNGYSGTPITFSFTDEQVAKLNDTMVECSANCIKIVHYCQEQLRQLDDRYSLEVSSIT